MSSDQIIIIGLIASAITFGLKGLASYFNYRPGRVVVNIGLYGVSAALAVAWSVTVWPSWPPFDGNIGAFVAAIWQYLNALMLAAAPVLGSATLIYNLLYEKVILPLTSRLFKSS